MLTIVVCTRNRAHMVHQWLLHTEQLFRDKDAPPILIIDQSDTPMSLDCTLDVRYTHTATRGLARARNLALTLVKTPYIAYCDDDCLLGDDWYAQALASITQHAYPDIMFGATWPYGNPKTYQLHHAHTWAGQTTWAQRDDGWCCTALRVQTTSFASARPVPVLESFGQGNNMILKRSAALDVAGFHPWLGAGAWLVSGEDVDMALLLLARRSRAIYDPRIVIYHDAWMPADVLAHLEHGYTTGMIAVHLWHAWHGIAVAQDYTKWRLMQIWQTLVPPPATTSQVIPHRPPGWGWRRAVALGTGVFGGLCLIVSRRYPR